MRKIYLILILSIQILSGCMISAGSYADAEAYSIKMDNLSIIQKFKQIKDENPEYQAFGKKNDGEVYNPDRQLKYYYDTYFKLPVKDTTVYIQAIVRNDRYTPNGEVLIMGYTFAYDIYRGWHRHKEKGYEKEHEMALQAFEKEVLDKLGVKYRKQWFR